jgi:ABC-type Fe3+-hydroxamate transport system substrate-binding protein
MCTYCAMGAAATATIEVTDALGRKVKVASPVQRVALNFNFEESTAVAGKDSWSKVVGISRAPWEGWRPVIFKRYAEVIPNLQAMSDILRGDFGVQMESLRTASGRIVLVPASLA